MMRTKKVQIYLDTDLIWIMYQNYKKVITVQFVIIFDSDIDTRLVTNSTVVMQL
jgi:hypothetical protein